MTGKTESFGFQRRLLRGFLEVMLSNSLKSPTTSCLFWEGTKLGTDSGHMVVLDLPIRGSPGGASGKEAACQCRLVVTDVGSIPGSERPPGGGHSNPLHYSYLENPMDKGAWWAKSVVSHRAGHD